MSRFTPTTSSRLSSLREATFDAGFFVVRTPLLPFVEFVSWGEGLGAGLRSGAGADAVYLEKHWSADVGVLRERLRALLDRPEIIRALHVASPSLRAGIAHWRRDPDSKEGLQAERSIVRYFERMCSRSTPFGLFSGCSVGSIGADGESTVLELEQRSSYRTSSRLDFDYLFALSGALRRDEAMTLELGYRPNSSLRLLAGAWHYTESRLQGAARSHHLVKLEDDPFLVAALERADKSATVAELVRAVVARDPGDPPSEEEAREFVLDLVRNDVLVPALSPLVTGEPALDDLIRQLRALPSGVTAAEGLESARRALAEMDERGPGSSPDVYEAIAAELRRLPADVDPAKLYQVDMRKPVVAARLGTAVMDELVRGAEILARMGRAREPEVLKTLREGFLERYDQRLVPLLEALDEETGLAFGAAPGEGAPLLRGLGFAAAGHGGHGAGGDDWNGILLRKVAGAVGSNGELVLTEEDLPPAPADHALPDAFCVLATLAGTPAGLERGDFQVVLRGGFGPSGARMFGRFCHADPELERGVHEHLRQEELHDPEAVYAEIVYVPEGRVGNVICRPRFRAYDIPYLGRSGAPDDRQLPLSDLLIGVEGDRLVLRSRRLGRRVVPRLTSAHGYMNPKLPAVYRLLCQLQEQGGRNVPGFSWGSLEALDFLPRVRIGRLVLSLARWKVSKSELETLTQTERSARFFAMQKLRRERGLPRWIVYHESDNALPADLDNPLSVDALAHVLKRATNVALTEMYPGPDELCVRGEEGHFCHELNVPMVLRPRVRPDAAAVRREPEVRALAAAVGRGDRTFAAGSEWLYVKLYGGPVVLDELLTTTLPPLLAAAQAGGALDRWFFIRFSDPRDHLRIRFNGPAKRLQREVLPLVFETFNPLLASGRIWRIQLDTYEREIERYGGREGVESAEDVFFADSVACLDVLRASSGDEGQDARWRAALYGIDALFSDFGFDTEARRGAVTSWRNQRQGRSGAPPKQQLADRFRAERKRLEALLGSPRGAEGELEFIRAAFERRSERMGPVVERLRALAARDDAGLSVPDLVSSYAHMHVNRLIRSAANSHELVIYDFLARLYEAQAARTRLAPAQAATPEVEAVE